jgi:hypothetical protein
LPYQKKKKKKKEKRKKERKIDSIAFVISTIKQNATENELAVTKTYGSNYLTYKYLVSTFNS